MDRDTLHGHERTLIDKLFVNGRVETSTNAVRAHYKTKGFNPATEIEPELRTAVDALLPASATPRRFSKAVNGTLFATGMLLIIWEWTQGYPAAAVVLVPMLVLTGTAWIAGHLFRGYLEWDRRIALLCLTPALAILAMAAAAVILSARAPLYA